jgi:6-phosphogluconolactonase
MLAVLVVLLCCAAQAANAGRTLYATDTSGSRVFGFTLAVDGSLTPIDGMPTFLTYAPSAIASSLDGRHVYATLPSVNSIAMSTTDSVGDLSSFGSSVATGATPAAITVSLDGTRLYVANAGSNSISRYAIRTDGSLASLGAATPTGQTPSAIAMTPDGRHLYVANASANSVSGYAVSSSGALTSLGPDASTDIGPVGLAVTPDGKYVYAANVTAGTVSSWSIGIDGALTPLSDPAVTGAGTTALAISPDGRVLLTANVTSSSVSRMFIDPASGKLTSGGDPTPGPLGARSIAISPDGHHAFVGGSSALTEYDLSAEGSLSPQAGSASLLTNGLHSGVVITPNQPPRAWFTFNTAPAGQDTTFSGRSSTDSDGAIADWTWDFGDGTTQQGPAASHAYARAGTYIVRLTVTDNEGCSTQPVYTGQYSLCAGSPSASLTQAVTVADPPPSGPPDPLCSHDGDDGFCGTPDHKAPQVTVLGIPNQASITTLDAPDGLAGSVTPDPSGIKAIRLRFMKADGTLVKRYVVTKRVCRTVRGKSQCKRSAVYKQSCRKSKGKRYCTRSKVVKVVDSKVPMCLAVSGAKSYLVKYRCAKAPWITVLGDTVFRYSLPVALATGSYTVDALAEDGVGNTDVLVEGRNHITFKIVRTPSNAISGVGTGGGGGAASVPTSAIDDTGSPFGRR